MKASGEKALRREKMGAEVGERRSPSIAPLATHSWVTETTHEWVTEVTHEWVAFVTYSRATSSTRFGDAELR